jgi:hypothetical protein
MTRVHQRCSVLVALGLLLVVGVCFAQGADDQGEAGAVVAAPIEVEGYLDRAPASLAVSVHGGLPAYRSVGIGAAVKADQFGVALRGAWGSVGLAFGAQARWYPPCRPRCPCTSAWAWTPTLGA